MDIDDWGKKCFFSFNPLYICNSTLTYVAHLSTHIKSRKGSGNPRVEKLVYNHFHKGMQSNWL